MLSADTNEDFQSCVSFQFPEYNDIIRKFLTARQVLENVMATQHGQYTQPGMEVSPVDGLNTAYDRTNEKYHLASYTAAPIPLQQEREPRICGRRKVTFWLMTALAVVLVVVIAVAVVAGIEGSKHRTQQKGKQYAGLRRLA